MSRFAMRVPTALGLVAALALGGCDWVDGTGAQPGDEADGAGGAGGPGGPDLAGPEPAPEPVDGAATVIDLGDVAPGAAIALLEGTRPRVVVPAADGAALGFVWEEVPLAEGALEACAGIDGFDPARAPTTLAEACTDPGACGLSFAPVDPGAEDDDGGVGAAAFRARRARAARARSARVARSSASRARRRTRSSAASRPRRSASAGSSTSA